MAERLTILPHDFDFIVDNLPLFTMVGVRIDPKQNSAQLIADSNGDYPTSGDQYIMTPLYRPKAVRQWMGFQVDIKHQFDGPDNQLTSVGYRLSDGTNQYFWDTGTSSWTVTTIAWSPEADIANNIQSFPTVYRQIQVVVKLATSSKTVTPMLATVHIAWSGKVEAFEDILYRSLVPLLKTTRMVTDFAVQPTTPTTVIDVLTPVRKAGYKFTVVDIDSVFNNNTDPEHYNNLVQAYDPVSGLVTLSSPIGPGQAAFCRLVVQPQVALISTSQDYTEVEASPTIQITEIESRESAPLSLQVGITNKATGDIIIIQPPYRFDLVFTMICLAPGGVDLTRILRAVIETMDNNPLIRSTATDEQYRIYMIDEFATTGYPQNNNLQQMRATFCIHDVLSYNRPAAFAKGVGQLNLRIQS